MLELSNASNYTTIYYSLLIKNGGRYVYYNVNDFKLDANPTMTHIELLANRLLYLQTDNFNYLATTKTPNNVFTLLGVYITM